MGNITGNYMIHVFTRATKLVAGLEHFVFFHILGIIIPID